MSSKPEIPRVAFVTTLQTQDSAADLARISHVVHLFRGHRLSCTWALSSSSTLELVQLEGQLGANEDLALATADLDFTVGKSFVALRDTLRKGLTEIQAGGGNGVLFACGDVEKLRPYVSILSENGIRGVIQGKIARGASAITPLPCGLLQFNCGMQIPVRSWLARIIPTAQTLGKWITKFQGSSETLLISVDASAVAHTTARGLRSLDRFLQEVSQAASLQQVQLVSLSELLAELIARRSPRPQQSILRSAA